MFCKNCGKELKKTVVFCPFCGNKMFEGQQEEKTTAKKVTDGEDLEELLTKLEE